MSFTPANIFDVRDKSVVDSSGNTHKVKLYVDGWAIGQREGMDVWAACKTLNDLEAKTCLT